MVLFWLGLFLVWLPLGFVVCWMLTRFYMLRRDYLHYMVRIVQEKPLFVVPRGQPRADAEDVAFPTTDNLKLRGCYLSAQQPRRGVILFGIEFGANRWSCRAYCEHLVEAGFDVFAFEPRNQGDSDRMPNYEPMPWLTEYEIQDAQAALAYLKGRPDADPRGVGFFGISKGGNAGLVAASLDPYVRCCVTDGSFGSYGVMLPYIRHWFKLYNPYHDIHDIIPDWYFGLLWREGLKATGAIRHCKFADVEPSLPRLSPRPLLMIHGEADTYVRPEMARALFEYAREPRQFWLVKDAKHNHALAVAGEEYRARLLEFFEQNLAAPVEAARKAAPRSRSQPGTGEKARSAC